MKVFLLAITISVLLFISSQASARVNDENLCGSNKIEISSCLLEGRQRKSISICAGGKGEFVLYLFGARKIEIYVKFSSD